MAQSSAPDARTWTVSQQPALRSAVLYFVLATVYIIVSDQLVTGGPAPLQTLKGILFVALTAVLTYYLIARSSNALERSHHRVRESEARLRRIIEASPNAVITLDGDLRIVQWSRAAEELFGWPAAEARGQEFLELLIPAAARSDAERRLRMAQQGENVMGTDCQARTRDDGRRWMRWTVNRVQSQEVGVTELLVVAEDVTERRDLGERLRQSQKMEAMGQLAGGVAHDFNNILTAIMCYAELLKADLRPGVPVNAAACTDVDNIMTATERAALLTRQLLAFSRRQVVRAEVLSPNRVIENLAPMLRRLIPENVALIQQLAPELWSVRADATQLEQILLNLSINARDAMPGGGRLIIETRNETLAAADVVNLAPLQPGLYVRLAITDNGIGMDAATRDRIFEPFFTTKGAGHGTGLGLPTVLSIVEQSGGHISVYSEPGKGSTFRIYLPALPQDQPVGAAGPVPSGVLHGTETIAVCEDDDSVRTLTCRALLGHGYHVIDAKHGEELLARAAAHRGTIDLLVTDVVLPGMNGREVAERMRATRRELAVLYVSGYTSDILAAGALGDHNARFLEKPFVPRVLLQCVREILDRRLVQQPAR